MGDIDPSGGRAAESVSNDLTAKVSPDMAVMSAAHNGFALDLYERIRSGKGNLVCSPISIAAALHMTMAGARGETERQMARVLHVTWDKPEAAPMFPRWLSLHRIRPGFGVEMHVANSIWTPVGFPLVPDFSATLRDAYLAEAFEVNFAEDPEGTRRRINEWTAAQTHNRVPEILAPGLLSVRERLVLVNAVYFKGLWKTPFNPAQTTNQPFRVAPGETVEAPAMRQTGTFGYYEDDRVQILEAMFSDENHVMTFLLPKEGGDLSGIESSLQPDTLSLWINRLESREVVVQLPRFRVTSRLDLVPPLQALGMTVPFSEAADFSGMTKAASLFIGAIVHQAFVEMDEQGAEAAAATAVMMRMTAMAPPPPIFRADRPFVFLIRNRRTNAILFAGRVWNPLG